MSVIAVMYPAEGAGPFDHDYYMATHMPLVHRLWGSMGLTDARVMRGTPGPDGAAQAAPEAGRAGAATRPESG